MSVDFPDAHTPTIPINGAFLIQMDVHFGRSKLFIIVEEMTQFFRFTKSGDHIASIQKAAVGGMHLVMVVMPKEDNVQDDSCLQ